MVSDHHYRNYRSGDTFSHYRTLSELSDTIGRYRTHTHALYHPPIARPGRAKHNRRPPSTRHKLKKMRLTCANATLPMPASTGSASLQDSTTRQAKIFCMPSTDNSHTYTRHASILSENVAFMSLVRAGEVADPQFSHIRYNGSAHHSEQALMQQWRGRWLDRWSSDPHQGWLRGKRIGEYGVGGGLLGQMLCETFGTAHYSAFDIAERQLREARARLQRTSGACTHKMVLASTTSPSGIDWRTHRLDALISQQVIQHFPTEQYTVDWLCTLATARIPKLLLEVRLHGHHGVGFANWAEGHSANHLEKNHYAVQFATLLDCDYIVSHLPGYILDWRTTHSKGLFGVCALSLG